MEKFDVYIGCKVINARPMKHNEFLERRGDLLSVDPDKDGYMVIYPDGYESWSPKETFEIAYRLVSNKEKSLI